MAARAALRRVARIPRRGCSPQVPGDAAPRLLALIGAPARLAGPGVSPGQARAWRGAASQRGASLDEKLANRELWHEPPKAWEEASNASSSSVNKYDTADVAMWRANFGFAKKQHSLAQIGYTDDELLEWRKPFDVLAKEETIDFPAFESFVARKYRGTISEEMLAEKVTFFWQKFDRDNSNSIDFGEFVSAGLLFDMVWCKEKIRSEGIKDTFVRYADDGFMIEPHFFKLMCDYRFFVATATDVRKLMLVADQDRDGLVSLADFVHWAERVDTVLEERITRKYGANQRTVKLPPPEPDDEEEELCGVSAAAASSR